MLKSLRSFDRHRRQRLVLLLLVALIALYVGLSFILRFNASQLLRADLELAGTTQDTLTQVVNRGFSTKPNVDQLIAVLQFEQVFQSMTTGELLRALVQYGMVPGYNTTTQLIEDLPSRGIDLSVLQPKPYGLLTALATAKGGPLLGSGPLIGTPTTQLALAARNALETFFQADKKRFLDNITPRNLLKLFDAERIMTSTTDARTNMFIYAWATPTGAVTNNIVPGYALYVRYSGIRVPLYRDPAAVRDIVNATVAGLLPGAPRVLMNTNYNQRLNEVWQPATGQYECLTQPCQELSSFDQTSVMVSGNPVTINLPWMDAWRDVIRSRMDDFFRRYRDVGGLLDVVIYDAEDYNFHIDQLFFQKDPQGNNVPSATIWAALRADSRWPALAAQLRQAGLTDADLSATATPWVWFGAKDYRALIWGKVMQERRTRYHTQAVYEPVRTYFPNVLFSNFRDAYQAHALPANNYIRMNNSWADVGSIVGNQQGPSPYSDGDATTPTGLFASLFQQKGKVAVDSFEVVNGKLILHFGENIRLPRSGGGLILSTGYRNDVNGVPFDHVPYVGDAGSRSYIITSHPDLRTYIVNFTGPNTSRVSQPGYPLLFITVANPYGQFIGMLRKVRSPFLASNVPIRTYVPSREYLGTELVPEFPYFAELVFHYTLYGAQIEFWNTSGANTSPATNRLMGDALKEVTDLIGFRTRKSLFSVEPQWTGDYVLSGMEAGGRKIWRLTHNGLLYDAPPTVVSAANPVRVIFNSSNPDMVPPYVFTMENAEIIPISSVSSQGFWIRQTQGNSYLTAPWPQVASALGL